MFSMGVEPVVGHNDDCSEYRLAGPVRCFVKWGNNREQKLKVSIVICRGNRQRQSLCSERGL